MERARDELLAGAALAGDQHRRPRRRDLAHNLGEQLGLNCEQASTQS